MTDLTESTAQGTVGPSPADIEADAIAAAARTVEQLKGKRLALVDRINVNKRSSTELAFDAFTGNGRARANPDDFNAEALTLDRELANLDSAIAEAERRHASFEASRPNWVDPFNANRRSRDPMAAPAIGPWFIGSALPSSLDSFSTLAAARN